MDPDSAALAAASEAYLTIGRIIRSLRRVEGPDTVTPGLASALGTLAQLGPMRLRELAEAEGVSAPTMSRMVAGLETSGYVDRSADPADARAAVLELTDTGRELINGMRSSRIRRLAQAMATVPEAERAQLSSALTRIERDLREHPGQDSEPVSS